MRLSKRLQAVASLVDGQSIIDVGCDHGYLSIYLTQKGIKCLATDISEYCILKAQENFKKYNLNIDTKITNGLNNIDIYRYDTVIISGMGTHTILNILANQKLPDTLIISSNNNIDVLRKAIAKLGYFIDNEIYVKEANHKYIIIRFKKGKKKYSELEYIVGPILINNQDYLDDLINDYQLIISKISNPNNIKRRYYENLLKQIKK